MSAPARTFALIWLTFAAQVGVAQVELHAVGDDHIAIVIKGQPFSDLYIGSAYPKPFLAPLRTVAGVIVTRRFPQEKIEGETSDHPHHRGLWIGYGSVNGINFWENEPGSKPSPENPQQKGLIRLRSLDGLKPGAKAGSASLTFAWQDASGHEVMLERRVMTFYADKAVRRIDVDATFSASAPVEFADTKEGFFAIRVADSMNGKNGGNLTNSEGAHTEKDVWGKRADWVDYDGAADGQKVGIVIYDHPRNIHHPPRWHARDYGLFAVNPFGVSEFDPTSKQQGGYRLNPGESLRFRWRVIVHGGDESKKSIARRYAEFVKESK